MYIHYLRCGANTTLAQVNRKRDEKLYVSKRMKHHNSNSTIINLVKEHKYILIELKHFMNENIVVGESFKWLFIQQSPTNAI